MNISRSVGISILLFEMSLVKIKVVRTWGPGRQRELLILDFAWQGQKVIRIRYEIIEYILTQLPPGTSRLYTQVKFIYNLIFTNLLLGHGSDRICIKI